MVASTKESGQKEILGTQLFVRRSFKLRAYLQGGRVTLASGLTLAGGQKIARVYKQNFTGRVTLQPGTT